MNDSVRIFLSYSRKDKDRVRLLANALERHGFSVWWDHDVPPGHDFDLAIEAALANASCVVVIWTEHSSASRYVRAEASDALSRGILVPALFQNVLPPLEFRQIQAANLSDWDGDPGHPEFEKLVRAIGSERASSSPQRNRQPSVSPRAQKVLLAGAFLASILVNGLGLWVWGLNLGMVAAILSALCALISACFGGRLLLVAVLSTAPTLAGSLFFGALNGWEYVYLGESLLFGLVASVPALALALHRQKGNAITRIGASMGISLVVAVACVWLLAVVLLRSAFPLWTPFADEDLQLEGTVRIVLNNLLLMVAASIASWPLWKAHIQAAAMFRRFLLVAAIYVVASREEAAVVGGIGGTEYILLHNLVVTSIVVSVLLFVAELLRRKSAGIGYGSLF